MSRSRTARVVLGAVALAGTALIGVAAPALASPLDAAPAAPASGEDVVPAPAPTAPPIDPSFTTFNTGDVLNQLSDFAPAGLPITGLVQSAAGATKIIPGH